MARCVQRMMSLFVLSFTSTAPSLKEETTVHDDAVVVSPICTEALTVPSALMDILYPRSEEVTECVEVVNLNN